MASSIFDCLNCVCGTQIPTKTSKAYLSLPTGPDSANGRASASGAGGRGFNPGPHHTKGVKNGTSGYLTWRSALKGKHWLFSHSLLTLLTLHKN